MKRLFSILAAALLTLSMFAQSGATCDDAIYVDGEYTANFAAGEYWFMSLTSILPMTINCYPSNQGAKAPEITVDFTCTYENGKAVYDDPKVAKMIQNAEKYGLSLPMTKKLSLQTDDNGKVYYSYTFPKNYQNMLYGQGVTYAIPAYVKLKVYSNTEAEIVSDAVSSRCRDYVNQLGMNTTLLMSPEDSVNTYVWPVGEWIKYKYEMTWTGKDGNSTLYMITSKDCEFDRNSGKIRDRFYLPAADEAHEVRMTPESSSQLIDDIFQTELYVRLYPKTEGYLKISTYEDKDNITDYVVGGVAAVVDNENMTISATLPAGTNREEAIKNAKYRPLQTYDGHQAEYNEPLYTVLTFGKVKYDLSGIVVAQKAGNTDASLKTIAIEGIDLPGFSPAVLDYFDIEVAEGKIPTVTATARKETSAVDIKQVTTVPGTATITVTAEAGNTQVYTVSFIRQRSKDNTLKALYVDGKLVEGFARDNFHYRMEVMNLPVITAELNDPKATMVIDQAKRVPGFGQVIVTAESGDVEVYSVNFVRDPKIDECIDVETINASQEYQLTGQNDKVLKLPMSQWGGKNAVLTWTGKADLRVSVLSTCLEEEGVKFDEMDVELQKGEKVRHCYLNTTRTLAWKRQAIDGYAYLRFQATETANFSVSLFTPNCVTRSEIIEVPAKAGDAPTTIDIAAHGTQIYSFFLDDLQNKDVQLRWEGNSTMEIFIADTCNFYLVKENQHIMRQANGEGYASLANGQAMNIPKNTAALWKTFQNYRGEDFVFMRYNAGAAGKLTVEVVKDYQCDDCTPVSQFTLSLEAQPAIGGTFEVTAEGGNITDNGNNTYLVDENATVTFRATANDHFTFRAWADGNATNPRIVKMTKDMQYTAVFIADKYTITVTANDPTKGRVKGSGRYDYGTVVEISATPFEGFKLDAWNDGNTDNPRTITVEGDAEYVANFTDDDHDALNNLNYNTDEVRKVVENGQIVILKNGKKYNILGGVINE